MCNTRKCEEMSMKWHKAHLSMLVSPILRAQNTEQDWEESLLLV